MRSTEDVLNDHLARRRADDLEGDLEANYSDDVLLLTKYGVYRGRDGVRHTAAILAENLPHARFSYDIMRVADGYGLLSWSGEGSDGGRTCHGAGTFVVRDGRIRVQTIHYEVKGGRG